MAKKKKELSLEEKLEQALVPVEEQPYEVPENWCWVTLDAIVQLYTGNSINEKVKKEKYSIEQPGYNFIATKDVGFDNEINYDTKVIIPYDEGFKVAPKNTSLLCIEGGSAGRKCGFTNVDVCFGNKLCAFKTESIESKYIFYYIQSNIFAHEFDSKKHGLIGGVSIKDLITIKIPLATKIEQKRIVEAIESMFAKLDEAKKIAENIVDGYEQHKLSIFNKAFSGELTCDRDYGNSGQDTIKNIASYAENISKKDKCNIQSFQNQVQYIEMDDGRVWAKTQIGAIGIVTNGSTPSRKCPEYWNGDIPWVSSGEVRNNELFFTNEKITQDGYDNSSVKLLPKGTVLIAMIGEGKTRGQTAVLSIEATTNQNIAAIVIDHGMIEPKYLWFWLQMQYKKNREKGSGSGPQALNCQRVRELEILVPSIEEQRDIVNILDSIIKKEEKMLNVAEQTLESIDSMKKSILAKAFRGELGTNIEFEESSIELLKEILGGVN